MTSIEQALFPDGGVHWVSAFDLSPNLLLITLHPCNRPQALIQARFSRPLIVSVESYAEEEEERAFPWDIIGFDSEQLPDGIWRFCLHTDSIEHVFDAPWPEITKAA